MTFELPKLGYDYDALEPHIDAKTMEIHHTKHHQAYLDKLNAALTQHPELYKKTIEEILTDLDYVPEDIRTAVRNNGGGFYHHTFFWEILSPEGGGEPEGELREAIINTFGSFENFKGEFEDASKAQFGSGWAWLSKTESGDLKVHGAPNQDSPLSSALKPIIGLDVWEHAYYLNYQNRRPDYIAAFWNIVNWKKAEENYLASAT